VLLPGFAKLPLVSLCPCSNILIDTTAALRCAVAGCCSSLVALNVSRNALPALPESMSRLARLQVLAADSNRCAHVPPKLSWVAQNIMGSSPRKLSHCIALLASSACCQHLLLRPHLHNSKRNMRHTSRCKVVLSLLFVDLCMHRFQPLLLCVACPLALQARVVAT
jgi:hypothetical protein